MLLLLVVVLAIVVGGGVVVAVFTNTLMNCKLIKTWQTANLNIYYLLRDGHVIQTEPFGAICQCM